MPEEQPNSQAYPWDDGSTPLDDPDFAEQMESDAVKDLARYVRDAIAGNQPPSPPSRTRRRNAVGLHFGQLRLRTGS